MFLFLNVATKNSKPHVWGLPYTSVGQGCLKDLTQMT
jgi:hypothetical protein